MSGPLVALNASAYDARPSGARRRAVGLVAGLLECGADVLVFRPAGSRVEDDIADELAGAQPAGELRVATVPFDGAAPVRRALRSERWFTRHVPRAASLFVTDYYPVLDRVPSAVTVHDLRYLAAPRHEPRARVLWFRLRYASVVQGAELILTPTQQVADEVVRHLGIAPGRIAVVPNAVGRPFRVEAPTPDPEHFLFVGTAEPRKGLDFLLDVFAAAGAGSELPPLVIAGRPGADRRRSLDVRRRLVETGRVRLRDVPDDGELVDLLRRAHALLFPSRYEGFGLPVLEALALGTPVVAARTPAVEEVAAGHATLLDGDDTDTWRDALREAVFAARAPDAAVRHARSFTRSRAARALLVRARRPSP